MIAANYKTKMTKTLDIEVNQKLDTSTSQRMILHTIIYRMAIWIKWTISLIHLRRTTLRGSILDFCSRIRSR